MASLSDQIIGVLESIWGKSTPVPLHAPTFSGNEWAYVKDTLDSTFVSSVGHYVDQFEEMLAEYTGAKRAVAVVNGTAALHVALILAGVQPGNEVLIPTLSFVATANAVAYCGAIPHFVDSDRYTLGMDPAKLSDYLKEIVQMEQGHAINTKTGRPIKAIVPMHTFGHPVDMAPLLETAEAYHIPVVEDAAESLGSFYQGTHTGTLGAMGILSFNGNKTITTGGGGAIITNDENLAEQAKHLTTTAKASHPWEYVHDQIGYNYRLPNLNAALGCAQMEVLQEFILRKRFLAKTYQKAFESICGMTIFQEPPFAKSNYWLNALMLDEATASQRDQILEVTNQAGYMTRPVWRLLHKLSIFINSPKMILSTAEELEKSIINIPSSSFLFCQVHK